MRLRMADMQRAGPDGERRRAAGRIRAQVLAEIRAIEGFEDLLAADPSADVDAAWAAVTTAYLAPVPDGTLGD